MDCLVLPVTLIRRRSTSSRLGYRPLAHDRFDEPDGPVTVIVGKEKRVFLVEPFVLQEYPFRLVMETMTRGEVSDLRGGVIFVDVDAILFEHMLWLLHNDSSSLLSLNLKEIIDFYAQEDC
ncbi:uncharacterized protein LOC129322643 isoform X3 [Prosopis cineraria]|uniref:uncharacterized protein LOC129322643 isoform X3 n=1 Tax=Prosopis cineraria TaxID=364024 RepID=UPI0024106751|nr:uncharacterized protein LOC129322643 isoform X3 [Prosopis cineraria]